jgi:hypothetical protein
MASVAADLARRSQVTRWKVEATVHADRKNLFAFAGEHGGYHVATLVSGSRSKLGRFDADARLIEKAPNLLALLKDCEEAFTADDSYALLRDACRKLIAEIE